ncbi:antibiotic biosynthesis monooxygenase family protein, partial [Sandarakinorhabdus sp.]|uniref:putative quinol monooxygenase n=1 Tax=Sandarakinorhabdus sp. TaxID=1916663 RepID=UPI003342006B
MFNRRDTLIAAGAGLIAGPGMAASLGAKPMYGRVGKLKAVAGQREALIAALSAGSTAMPGNSSYVIARDAADADGIWIWESWDSAESHRASLALPQVKQA